MSVNRIPEKRKIVVTRGVENYVFVLNIDNKREVASTLRMAARWASNEELSFSWQDAARVANSIKQMANL